MSLLDGVRTVKQIDVVKQTPFSEAIGILPKYRSNIYYQVNQLNHSCNSQKIL